MCPDFSLCAIKHLCASLSTAFQKSSWILPLHAHRLDARIEMLSELPETHCLTSILEIAVYCSMQVPSEDILPIKPIAILQYYENNVVWNWTQRPMLYNWTTYNNQITTSSIFYMYCKDSWSHSLSATQYVCIPSELCMGSIHQEGCFPQTVQSMRENTLRDYLPGSYFMSEELYNHVIDINGIICTLRYS